MKFKFFSSFYYILVFSAVLINSPNKNAVKTNHSTILDEPTMCTALVGRCTGSAYCTACKNCSRCAYCNSGERCGVCRKSARTYRPKKKKRNTNTSKYNIKKLPSSSSVYQPKYSTEDIYILKEKTSLRQTANSKASVLRRLAKNDSVLILDGFSEKYWCKVTHQGKEGWVKKHLLEKRKIGIYP